MFSYEPRCRYRKAPVAEVICQLRFPEILTIEANAPVDFQEAIRQQFPHYSVRRETPPPKLVGTPGNMKLDNQNPTNNYQFVSADGRWRVNLTSRYIALGCSRYESWEEFAMMLDGPLAAFIKIYRPALFERVGLRYVNFISRKALGLEDSPWRDLIQPQYLGLLADDEVQEQATSRNSIDAELALRGGCRAKIHAGPGMVKRNGQQDNEVKFVYDLDLFMQGNIAINLSAGSLQTLHSQADSLFRGAITDKLHRAMEPEIL